MAEEPIFTRWILDQLTERGWSQAEFARRANISTAQVSQVLAGNNNPGLDFFQGTARAFGVPLEDVLRLAEILPPLPAGSETDDLLTRLRRLPPAVQTRVLSIWEVTLAQFEQLGRPK